MISWKEVGKNFPIWKLHRKVFGSSAFQQRPHSTRLHPTKCAEDWDRNSECKSIPHMIYKLAQNWNLESVEEVRAPVYALIRLVLGFSSLMRRKLILTGNVTCFYPSLCLLFLHNLFLFSHCLALSLPFLHSSSHFSSDGVVIYLGFGVRMEISPLLVHCSS